MPESHKYQNKQDLSAQIEKQYNILKEEYDVAVKNLKNQADDLKDKEKKKGRLGYLQRLSVDDASVVILNQAEGRYLESKTDKKNNYSVNWKSLKQRISDTDQEKQVNQIKWYKQKQITVKRCHEFIQFYENQREQSMRSTQQNLQQVNNQVLKMRKSLTDYGILGQSNTPQLKQTKQQNDKQKKQKQNSQQNIKEKQQQLNSRLKSQNQENDKNDENYSNDNDHIGDNQNQGNYSSINKSNKSINFKNQSNNFQRSQNQQDIQKGQQSQSIYNKSQLIDKQQKKSDNIRDDYRDYNEKKQSKQKYDNGNILRKSNQKVLDSSEKINQDQNYMQKSDLKKSIQQVEYKYEKQEKKKEQLINNSQKDQLELNQSIQSKKSINYQTQKEQPNIFSSQLSKNTHSQKKKSIFDIDYQQKSEVTYNKYYQLTHSPRKIQQQPVKIQQQRPSLDSQILQQKYGDIKTLKKQVKEIPKKTQTQILLGKLQDKLQKIYGHYYNYTNTKKKGNGFDMKPQGIDLKTFMQYIKDYQIVQAIEKVNSGESYTAFVQQLERKRKQQENFVQNYEKEQQAKQKEAKNQQILEDPKNKNPKNDIKAKQKQKKQKQKTDKNKAKSKAKQTKNKKQPQEQKQKNKANNDSKNKGKSISKEKPALQNNLQKNETKALPIKQNSQSNDHAKYHANKIRQMTKLFKKLAMNSLWLDLNGFIKAHQYIFEFDQARQDYEKYIQSKKDYDPNKKYAQQEFIYTPSLTLQEQQERNSHYLKNKLKQIHKILSTEKINKALNLHIVSDIETVLMQNPGKLRSIVQQRLAINKPSNNNNNLNRSTSNNQSSSQYLMQREELLKKIKRNKQEQEERHQRQVKRILDKYKLRNQAQSESPASIRQRNQITDTQNNNGASKTSKDKPTKSKSMHKINSYAQVLSYKKQHDIPVMPNRVQSQSKLKKYFHKNNGEQQLPISQNSDQLLKQSQISKPPKLQNRHEIYRQLNLPKLPKRKLREQSIYQSLNQIDIKKQTDIIKKLISQGDQSMVISNQSQNYEKSNNKSRNKKSVLDSNQDPFFKQYYQKQRKKIIEEKQKMQPHQNRMKFT